MVHEQHFAKAKATRLTILVFIYLNRLPQQQLPATEQFLNHTFILKKALSGQKLPATIQFSKHPCI